MRGARRGGLRAAPAWRGCARRPRVVETSCGVVPRVTSLACVVHSGIVIAHAATCPGGVGDGELGPDAPRARAESIPAAEEIRAARGRNREPRAPGRGAPVNLVHRFARRPGRPAESAEPLVADVVPCRRASGRQEPGRPHRRGGPRAPSPAAPFSPGPAGPRGDRPGLPPSPPGTPSCPPRRPTSATSRGPPRRWRPLAFRTPDDPDRGGLMAASTAMTIPPPVFSELVQRRPASGPGGAVKDRHDRRDLHHG